MDLGERAASFKFLLRDRDSKFTAAFDDVLAGNDTRVIKTPVRAPRANSFAERFVSTLRRQCLDHLLILGERHLREVLAEYARHYNGHRPHQALHQRPPLHESSQAIDMTAPIERSQVVGSLISEYRRAAWRTQSDRSAAVNEYWHGTPSAAGPAKTASRSRSMPNNSSMSFRAASGNDLRSSRPGYSSAPSSGKDARAASPLSRSRARSRPAHPTSRSRPSLPITGVLTGACATIHALRQTD